MARDTVTVTPLTRNAGTTLPAGTTITAANGAVLNLPNGKSSNVALFVQNVDTSARNVTIRAGVNEDNGGPAQTSGQGDLVVAIPASSTTMITMDTARFAQAGGKTVYIDFVSQLNTGKVYAIAMPKG